MSPDRYLFIGGNESGPLGRPAGHHPFTRYWSVYRIDIMEEFLRGTFNDLSLKSPLAPADKA